MRKVSQLVAIGATMCLALGACSNGTSVSQGKTDSGKDSKEVTYRLWDAGQQATYQKCAVAFEKETGIKVKIEQQGWDDYWKNLTTDLVSGTAPDVITNHVQYYPELAGKGQLLDLNQYMKDGEIDFPSTPVNLPISGSRTASVTASRRTGTPLLLSITRNLSKRPESPLMSSRISRGILKTAVRSANSSPI